MYKLPAQMAQMRILASQVDLSENRSTTRRTTLPRFIRADKVGNIAGLGDSRATVTQLSGHVSCIPLRR